MDFKELKEEDFVDKYGTWTGDYFDPPKVEFNSKHCGAINDRQVASPLDALKMIWSDEIWHHIIDCTNQRGRTNTPGWTDDEHVDEDESSDEIEEEVEENISTNANWRDIDLSELKTWLAIQIVMGLCPQPAFEKYWAKQSSNSGIFGNDFIRNSGMSRDRWLQIRKFIFCDTDYVTKQTVEASQKQWRPFPFISIDETLILFKGRFKYRQHVRGKPNATGLKLYAMCDNKGFIYGFWFYLGDHPTIHDLVVGFADQLPSTNFVITVDPFYGGYDLMDTLQERGFKFILACQINHPTSIWIKNLVASLPIVHPKRKLRQLSLELQRESFLVLSMTITIGCMVLIWQIDTSILTSLSTVQ